MIKSLINFNSFFHRSEWLLVCVLVCFFANSQCEGNSRLAEAQSTVPAVGASDSLRLDWWPKQKMPKGILTLEITEMRLLDEPGGTLERGATLNQEHMTAQSLAGLAAQAVNGAVCDELIYLNHKENKSYQHLRNVVFSRLDLEDRGEKTLWEAVQRFAERGVVKGYILYSWDNSEGEQTNRREGSDESVNVATSLAGVLGAIVVSEAQEADAREIGLTRLADVRGRTEQWLYDTHRGVFNNEYLLLQDPIVPNNRAIAVAHKIPVVYGLEEPTESFYASMKAGSLVFGWNDGHSEGESVSQHSKYGHFIVPSNWALNLPVLSLSSERELPRFAQFDPREIDFEDTNPKVSFFLSDGDNLQWLLGSFVDNKSFWAAEANGKFPMNWGLPLADLAQVGIDTYLELQSTQAAESGIVLFPGYCFPDEFGINYIDDIRSDLLVEYAHRIEHHLKISGAQVVTLLSNDYASDGALEAYATLIREIPSMSGLLIIDYSPYEKGDGKVFWFPNADGIDIPVITAKYTLWANLNFPRSGTPLEIANLINRDAQQFAEQGESYYNWVSVHAWSRFIKEEGCNEGAENGTPKPQNVVAGVSAVEWCISELNPKVGVVTVDELIWRIRMTFRPSQTRRILSME